jgi:hypothetical protein
VVLDVRLVVAQVIGWLVRPEQILTRLVWPEEILTRLVWPERRNEGFRVFSSGNSCKSCPERSLFE